MGIDFNLLTLYRNKAVQKELVRTSQHKEVGVKLGEQGFGKRPDVLLNGGDVVAFAKQGVTSFHVSEELWSNPLNLVTGMKKHEMEALRVGWDLILDVDCPFWILAKITTWLLVKSLREHGITSVTVKFSGNKGFHIAVPYEAFPKMINGKETRNLFPDAPRTIAGYLLNYIGSQHIIVRNNKVYFGSAFFIPFERLKAKTGKTEEELVQKFCTSCKKELKSVELKKKKIDFQCASCGSFVAIEDDKNQQAAHQKFHQCPKCKKLMERMEYDITLCDCGSNDYYTTFRYQSIIEVDTILISHRHLYRGLYSAHEKSGLVSIPIDPQRILSFEKKQAALENLPLVFAQSFPFLGRTSAVPGEAEKLLRLAFEFSGEREREARGGKAKEVSEEFEQFQQAVPVDLFPPCMHNILAGMKDGKKRAMFVFTNFLTSVGWTPDAIEELLLKWNQKNPEPLRENLIQGHVRYLRQKRSSQQTQRTPPPSCDNKMYYIDMGICTPDHLCKTIRNPLQYVRKKLRFLQQQRTSKPGEGGNKESNKRILSDDQKQRMQEAKKKYKEFREQMKGKKEHKEKDKL